MLFLLNLLSILSTRHIIIRFDEDSDTENDRSSFDFLTEESLLDRSPIASTSRSKNIFTPFDRLANKNSTETFGESKKSKFVRKMTKLIYNNIDRLLKRKEIEDNDWRVQTFLSLTFDYFIDYGDEKVNEMIIFLANAFYNTSYLKIFLSEQFLKENIKTEKRTEFSRGLLQLFGEYNYAIANRYSGETDFVSRPEKMAYLTSDSIKATLFFWRNLVKQLKQEGKKVNFSTVLKKLNPEEVQGNNQEIKEYREKLRRREYDYRVIRDIVNNIFGL